ncbi:hypothetical protein Riv7116_0360 [Rivularia sp. PCC 7116]|uniref:hypothetical protein n=1 Tax=Rivularia sp. PCC 7116 TaxID=373994 RepID=UPI00029EE5A8|nr:hypothetical protein [Rivularia sp. PCC 7116]AFY52964.1 hypothetical protein Riv7116_0360 [Rivularia sp. PCC 7116]
MNNYRVISRWIVSPDGKIVVEAKSAAAAVGDRTEIHQSVSVNQHNGSCSSSSSSSSSSYSSSSSSVARDDE